MTSILAQWHWTLHWFLNCFIVYFGRTRGIESTIRGSWSKQVLQKIIILLWLILFFTATLQLCMTGIQIIKHTVSIATIWVIVRRNIRNYWSIDAKIMCISWKKLFLFHHFLNFLREKCLCVCVWSSLQSCAFFCL